MGEQGPDVGIFDNLTGVHDRDFMGGLRDNAQVVGDQQYAHAALCLEVIKQRENLSLDRDIQSRGRLVRNEHVRIGRQRHGDHDSLTHSTRKVVRISFKPA